MLFTNVKLASVLQSGSIRLLAGDKEFVVHRRLLEHNLKNIHIFSRDRCVDFDGDEESVGYLLEYLYTGDYTPVRQVQEQPPRYGDDALSHNTTSSQRAAEQEPHPMVLAARTSGLGIWGRPAALHTTFYEEILPTQPQQSPPVTSDYPHPASVTSAGNPAAAQSSEHSVTGGHNIASTFLTHAKVYLLAERYGCASLQDFSLQRLRAALKTSELEPSANNTGHSILLIRDIYELPRQNSQTDTVQKLRDIVVTHAVSQLEELQANKDFGAYVKEGGDFVTDLLSSLTTSRLSLR